MERNSNSKYTVKYTKNFERKLKSMKKQLSKETFQGWVRVIQKDPTRIPNVAKLNFPPDLWRFKPEGRHAKIRVAYTVSGNVIQFSEIGPRKHFYYNILKKHKDTERTWRGLPGRAA